MRPESNISKRPVALLDVNNTLIDNTNNINHKLINALKESQITDVYLFTNMDANDVLRKAANPQHVSRLDLVNILKEAGLTVHGVITPADLSYNKGLGAAFREWALPYYGKININDLRENVAAQKILDKLYTIQDDYNRQLLLQKAATLHNTSQPTPEKYQSARILFQHHNNRSNLLESQLPGHNASPHKKGNMWRYFMNNLPDWCSSVILFDDDKNVASGVQAAQQGIKEELRIPLTIIRVDKNFTQTKSGYVEVIVEHIKSANKNSYWRRHFISIALIAACVLLPMLYGIALGIATLISAPAGDAVLNWGSDLLQALTLNNPINWLIATAILLVTLVLLWIAEHKYYSKPHLVNILPITSDSKPHPRRPSRVAALSIENGSETTSEQTHRP